MATQETVKKIFGLVFFKFPGRRPATEGDGKLALQIWSEIYKTISDPELMSAAARFIAETTKIYPDDDPFAMIRELARPILPETEGDCVELAFEAVQSFGYMREKDAMDWLKVRSPLVAAAVQRVGFLEICRSEEPDVIRGQLRAIFKAEKERSVKHGGVVESATHLTAGLPDNERLIGLTKNIGKSLKVLPGGAKNANTGQRPA
jgi:hypothetical protein